VSSAVCRPIDLAAAKMPVKADLHQRLAAGDGQPALHRAQRRGEVAEPRDTRSSETRGAVLQVPGVRVVAVLAAQRTAGDEERDADAGPSRREPVS
jgi:hypothetical protein